MSFDVRAMRVVVFFFSSRRRHTRFDCDWSSDVCSSDLLRWLVCFARSKSFPRSFTARIAILPGAIGKSARLDASGIASFQGANLGPAPRRQNRFQWRRLISHTIPFVMNPGLPWRLLVRPDCRLPLEG